MPIKLLYLLFCVLFSVFYGLLFGESYKEIKNRCFFVTVSSYIVLECTFGNDWDKAFE